MQIHDLNTKTLTNPAYVAFDDGSDTYKADFKAEIDNAAAEAVADADLTDNTVAFTSGDAESPTEWTEVSVLTSGLPIKTLFNRISTMIKNVRWLYSKLGTTDISSIGGGTVTGAISSLNSNIQTQNVIGTYSGTLSSQQYITLSENTYNYQMIVVRARVDVWQTFLCIPHDYLDTLNSIINIYHSPTYNYSLEIRFESGTRARISQTMVSAAWADVTKHVFIIGVGKRT